MSTFIIGKSPEPTKLKVQALVSFHERLNARFADNCLTRPGQWIRVNPMDLHGDGHSQHPLAVLGPELNRDFTSITLRQFVSADLGRSARGLPFGSIEAVELQACFIRDEARAFPNVEIEPGHCALPPSDIDDLARTGLFDLRQGMG
ncbi:hypothetical protein I2H36_18480 [Microvirga sp. BT290]|uniref:Uncharacterized protein n=1 Tax=Microvirga terrestris TaxID=2791024 RepID=A0ABS0HXF8_9HYPH|nr:hypothetical protein [Microvirga terrestris]